VTAGGALVGITGADLAACRGRLRTGSRSFALAARLLPGTLADAATGLYAFCRVADDAIDDARDAAERRAALAMLQRRLDQACAGRPADHPEDRALAALMAVYGIPRALPGALLEGFAWDAEGRTYDTLAELEAYAVRVAGSVGMMLCLLMGQRSPAQLAHACDLGVAMQLTNVARDIGEDARRGRLYLPADWLRAQGVAPAEWLHRPRHDARLAAVVERLLARAETLYRSADAGVAELPWRCRPGIRAARLIYADIGRALAARGFDAVGGRAVVGAGRKARLLAGALLAHPSEAVGPAVHPDTQTLVTAVVRHPLTARSVSPWVNAAALFLRLDRRTRSITGVVPGGAASGTEAAG